MKPRTRLVSTLWLSQLVNSLDRVAIGFAGPAIMSALALSPSEFGIIMSSFGVGYFIAQAPGGFLADRWGTRTMLVLGPLLWALFTGITGLVSTLASFVVVRFCFGLSEGLTNTSISKAIGETFAPEHRARTIAICTTALTVGPAVGGPLVGVLIGAWGWQAAFYLLTIPSLIAAAAAWLFLPKRPAKTSGEPGEMRSGPGLWSVLRQPRVMLLAGATFAWNIPYWGYMSWMPTYLANSRNLDIKAAGMLGGVPYILAFFGVILGGWLGSRFHRFCPLIVTLAFFAAGLFMIFAYQANTVTLAVIGLSGAAFCLFGSIGPIGKIGLDLAPDHQRGAFIGVVLTVGQIGAICAPALIGFLVDWTHNFAAGFAFMVGALWVSAACYTLLGRMVNPGPVPQTT